MLQSEHQTFRPRLHPLLGTPLLFLAFVACSVPALLLTPHLEPLAEWLRAPGSALAVDPDTGQVLKTEPSLDLPTIILRSLATWLLAIPALIVLSSWLRFGRERLGLGSTRQTGSVLFSVGLATGIALIAMPALLALLLGGYSPASAETISTLSAPTGSAALPGVGLLVVGLFIAAFGEELLCRGLLLRYWEPLLGTSGALLLSTVIFAALHYSNDHVGPLPLIGLLLAGLLLGAVFLLSGNLWLVTGLHLGWNVATALLFGLPVSGFQMPAVFRLQTADDSLWHLLLGGQFGPEEGLLYHLVLVLAGVLFVSRVRPAASLAAAPSTGPNHPPTPDKQQ